MIGKRTGFFAAMATAMLLLGGCGNTTAGNHLGGAIDANGTETANGRYGTGRYGTGTYDTTDSSLYGVGGTAYWDGYGINSGREMFQGNAERNTYGMRTGDLMQDARNAVDDLTGGGTRTSSAVD